MRTLITGLTSAVVLCALAATAGAQTIAFQYAAPTALMVGNLPVADLRDGQADGYRSIEITPANLGVIRKIGAPSLLRTFDAFQAGTPFRARVDRMLAISQGGVAHVQVWLVDDRTGLPANAQYRRRAGPNAVPYAWPAGGNFVSAAGKPLVGLMAVGEFWAAVHEKNPAYERTGWESILLHELLHTQFMEPGTKWGPTSIAYGLDGEHDWSEVLGSQDAAFEEGLGNFFGAVHFHPAVQLKTNAFFGRTDARYMFEDGSIPASWRDLREAADSSKEVPVPAAVAAAQPTRRTFTRYFAKWSKVPGKYLLFNEWTSLGFHLFFWQNVNGNPTDALQMIERMAGAMSQRQRTRKLSFAANNLAVQLEAYAATPAGQAKKNAGSLSSSMFPIAVLDLLTHFGMTEADYKLEFTRDQPPTQAKALAEYWKHRDAVRALVDRELQASPIGIQRAVTAVHAYFQRPDTILVP